jgi:hypothetical protein
MGGGQDDLGALVLVGEQCLDGVTTSSTLFAPWASRRRHAALSLGPLPSLPWRLRRSASCSAHSSIQPQSVGTLAARLLRISVVSPEARSRPATVAGDLWRVLGVTVRSVP